MFLRMRTTSKPRVFLLLDHHFWNMLYSLCIITLFKIYLLLSQRVLAILIIFLYIRTLIGVYAIIIIIRNQYRRDALYFCACAQRLATCIAAFHVYLYSTTVGEPANSAQWEEVWGSVDRMCPLLYTYLCMIMYV